MLYKYCEVKKNIYKWRDNNREEYNEYLKNYRDDNKVQYNEYMRNYMKDLREYKKDFDFDRIVKVFRKILL